MKQYNKTHCPEVINYKGQDFKKDIEATHKYREGQSIKGANHIRVNVLSNNLKGRTDLHGKTYTPNVFIYSNE